MTQFPWQRRLVEQLARENRWPDVLDLPSGTGKTAALDVAVFHLALQADRKERCAALRIILVVDRRLVVDDADRRARKIACALRDPARCSEAAWSARLGSGCNGSPAPAHRRWSPSGCAAERPWSTTGRAPRRSRPFFCSTVDQVGSRLLFRGYGVSNRMKPVHAGLLGEDSLILLDEAHLSEPFLQTLQAVRTVGGANVTPVVLTATPGGSYERPFQLGAGDVAGRLTLPRLRPAARQGSQGGWVSGIPKGNMVKSVSDGCRTKSRERAVKLAVRWLTLDIGRSYCTSTSRLFWSQCDSRADGRGGWPPLPCFCGG